MSDYVVLIEPDRNERFVLSVALKHLNQNIHIEYFDSISQAIALLNCTIKVPFVVILSAAPDLIRCKQLAFLAQERGFTVVLFTNSTNSVSIGELLGMGINLIFYKRETIEEIQKTLREIFNLL